MSLFNKYDSSKANTDITITVQENVQYIRETYSTTSVTRYSATIGGASGRSLYKIPSSSFGAGTNILLKMKAPSSFYANYPQGV